MTGYVSRDRRASALRVLGISSSALVAVAVTVATGHPLVAVVGVPVAVAAAWWWDGAAETPVRADADGISLTGRWTAWADVEEVGVGRGQVRVTLRDDAPLPGWATAHVRGVGPAGDRLVVETRLRGDPDEVVAGLRAVAAPHVRVTCDTPESGGAGSR